MQDRITEFVLEIFRTHGELIAMGDDLVADLGLSSARWQVMGAIVLAEKPLPIAQIARNMGLTRQAVQRVANELDADGFVRFAPNPDHQRARLVLLTAKGQSAYAAAMKRWEAKARALGSGSTQKDIETALAALRRLRRRLAKNEN
jgi:DNA-binding MarR family transcriptional regulator